MTLSSPPLTQPLEVLVQIHSADNASQAGGEDIDSVIQRPANRHRLLFHDEKLKFSWVPGIFDTAAADSLIQELRSISCDDDKGSRLAKIEGFSGRVKKDPPAGYQEDDWLPLVYKARFKHNRMLTNILEKYRILQPVMLLPPTTAQPETSSEPVVRQDTPVPNLSHVSTTSQPAAPPHKQDALALTAVRPVSSSGNDDGVLVAISSPSPPSAEPERSPQDNGNDYAFMMSLSPSPPPAEPESSSGGDNDVRMFDVPAISGMPSGNPTARASDVFARGSVSQPLPAVFDLDEASFKNICDISKAH